MKDVEKLTKMIEEDYTITLNNTIKYSKVVDNLINTLKNKRIEKKLSISDISKKTGLSEKDIKSFENYSIMPTLLMFIKIINALDLKMELKEIK